MDRPRPTWNGQPIGETQAHASREAKGGYVELFDVRDKPYPWPTFVGPLALFVFGVVMLRFRRFGHGWKRRLYGWSFVLLTGSALIAIVLGYAVERARLVRHLESGAVALVEGTVTAFHPGGVWRGETTECFTLGDKRFCYSDGLIAPGFTETAAYGGPMRAGLRVRVRHVGRVIVQLEIQRE